MVNPVSGKAIAKVVTTAVSDPAAAQKTTKLQPSKFDKVLEQQKAQSLPPEIRTLPKVRVEELKADLGRKLEASRASDGREFFREAMSQTRNRLEALQTRVTSATATDSNWQTALRSRLVSIEKQFQESDRLVQKLTQIDDHQALLQAQLEIHKVAENIEILTKVVEQLSSGVKTIIQTQV